MSGAGLNEAVRVKDALALFWAVKSEAVPRLVVDNSNRPKVVPTLAEIKRVVASMEGVPLEAMTSSCRKHVWAHPRQRAMYLAREMTTCSFPQIARHFGGKDHTTILFSYRKVLSVASRDRQLEAHLDRLRSAILTAAAERQAGAVQ